MDELLEFCVRMLGEREAGARAAQAARSAASRDRSDQLTRAIAACRRAGEDEPAVTRLVPGPPGLAGPPDLADVVAGELAAAAARLPQRQREALALREMLRCSHREVARAIGIEAVAAAPLLARARVRLRSELRGTPPPPSDCLERERGLRTIALRQDGEPVPEADDDWLIEHLGHCVGCGQAHAAMLEASVCYRAWPVPDEAAWSPGPAFEPADARAGSGSQPADASPGAQQTP